MVSVVKASMRPTASSRTWKPTSSAYSTSAVIAASAAAAAVAKTRRLSGILLPAVTPAFSAAAARSPHSARRFWADRPARGAGVGRPLGDHAQVLDDIVDAVTRIRGQAGAFGRGLAGAAVTAPSSLASFIAAERA